MRNTLSWYNLSKQLKLILAVRLAINWQQAEIENFTNKICWQTRRDFYQQEDKQA